MSMNVGDIYATLGIDTSEFKKGTEEAVSSIRKFGKFVDDVMAKTSGSVKGAGVLQRRPRHRNRISTGSQKG